MKNLILRLFVSLLLILNGLSVWQVAAATQIDIPGPAGSGRFGTRVTALPNGNIVVTDPEFDAPGVANVGAVYLYNGATGALISRLIGSLPNDSVGNRAPTVLPNGNYVVQSTGWNNGAGAVTLCNGTTGCSGAVSAANSLIGSMASDNVGDFGITILANSNYVVRSSNWSSGGVVNAGAVTWCSGTSGCIGAVSASNSLVGSTAQDRINIVVALTNGNYVAGGSQWDNGGIVDAGAMTFCNGTSGCTGIITSANSLVGSTADDSVGLVTALTNGNYVVGSLLWNNGAIGNAGALTFCNGTSGCQGVISPSNSLVGSTTDDFVGRFAVKTLINGNYVVFNPDWDNGAIVEAGAVTFCNGTSGCQGAVSSANSLVGSTANNSVGFGGVTVLANDNYVVHSPAWDNGATANVGAVTLCNGASGCTGAITSGNSLIGSTANDSVGEFDQVKALTNGNYVVSSRRWDNGSITDAGAVTLCNGITGCAGIVSTANSLVGTGTSEGERTITALTNGNYVIGSQRWDNGSIVDAGAVTFCNGTSGCIGIITTANSLVGSTANDFVGGAMALANGNYVVNSSQWDNGAIINVGAITFCNGTSGCAGVITSGSSLVGSTAGDFVGSFGLTALTNGNYVVNSPVWDNIGILNAGAVTFCNGTNGCFGVVSSTNSLVGGAPNDRVGNITIDAFDNIRIGGVTALTNGNYVVHSTDWDSSTIANAGAISYGDGISGTVGQITSANSVRGTIAFGAGLGANFSFDAVNNQLVVGRLFENIITLFRPMTTPTPTPTATPTPTPTATTTPTPTPTPNPGNVCTPTSTVSEGDLFPGGIVSFGVTTGPGSVTVDHVNAGTGLQSLTVVGTPTNAVVTIPPFTAGTTAPVVVTFTTPTPGLAVDFTLRAASTFHAVFIHVRCAQTCTPTTTVTEGDLFPGGIVSFGVSSGPGTVTVDHVNAGTGLQSLTVVGTPVNATVFIPAFTAGTTAPVNVGFLPTNPALPVDFTLRAASTFHAANIRVRCGTPPPPIASSK